MNLSKQIDKNILIITLTGMILRLVCILSIKTAPVSDFSAYQEIAASIYKGEPNNFLGFQGPGYPLVLGIFYRLFETPDIFVGKALNFVLSSFTLVFISKIFTVLFSDKRIVYLSYAIAALLPNYIIYNVILATETLYLFLFSLIVLLQISNSRSYTSYFLLGLVTGVSALVKPYMIVYPVIAAAAFWLKNKKLRKALLYFTLVQLVCLITVAPWTFRNYKIYRQFVPISFNNGYVMYLNNNDESKGVWIPLTEIKMSGETIEQIHKAGYSYEQAISIFSPELNTVFKREAVKWIRNNPIRFAELALLRLNNTFLSGSQDVYIWGLNKEIANTSGDKNTTMGGFEIFNTCILVILSLSGLFFLLRYILFVIKSFFNGKKAICYVISIPILNTIFSIMLSVVYEGQPRYNFNNLFLFAACFSMLIFSRNKLSDYS